MRGRTTFRAWRWEGGRISVHRGGVPLDDRGFRYGRHLFESLAVRDGSILLGAGHLALLAGAAARNGFPFPRTLAAALRAFLGQAKTRRLADGMLRIFLTAGPGAPGAPILRPGCYLTWEATRFPTPEELAKGYSLVALKEPVEGVGWGEKSGNYANHLAAFSSARSAGSDEGILFDREGRVLSCAMGNVLVWLPSRSGLVLCTPSPKLGARSGAVLGWVRRHTHVVEKKLTRSDLRRATAMAVTNSRLGVMPVRSLEGRKLDTSASHALSLAYLRSHGLLGNA